MQRKSLTDENGRAAVTPADDHDVAWAAPGSGSPALLLPALSSVSTRDEMTALAKRLGNRLRCVIPEWPGFGAELPRRHRLRPADLDDFLDDIIDAMESGPVVGVAAGHGAPYLVKAARRRPGRFNRLVLIAPTWRGPLPTMMGGRRPALWARARAALELPIVGPLLYRLNLNRPMIGWMMREHVYEDPANVTAALLRSKMALTHRPGARLGTAAFISGGLDPVASRDEFLGLFGRDLPPLLLLRPRSAPPRSAAEMDALAATGLIEIIGVAGALAPHEEHADEVASRIVEWLAR